jgi:hypothetical protein
MSELITRSRSRAEDAAHRAAADVAEAVDAADYRLIGGQMVTLLVAKYEPPDAPQRATADADAGLLFTAVADGSFLTALTARGYIKRRGNRFVRDQDAIDVLVPAATSRARHNRRVGMLVVDEVPGLAFALSRPPERVDVTAALTDGQERTYTASLPDPLAALVLKALAWEARLADKDVIDTHRCLAIALAAGIRPDDWAEHPEADRARRILRGQYAVRRPTEVRALIAAVCGPITPPPPSARFG